MPVRTIPKSHRSLTGQIASRTQGRPVAFESALERDFALLQLFDPAVASIEEQPVRIDYRTSSGRAAHYTPDFLVTHRASAQASRLVEVKYQAELDQKAASYAERFAAGRAYAADRGWVFEVVTESVIRGPRLDNVRFLLPFQKRRFAPELQDRLLDALGWAGALTVSELLEKVSFSNEMERANGLACIWQLLARGCVFGNLWEPLSMTTVLRLAEESAHVR